MKKQINDLLLKMQKGENCIGETANELLKLYNVGKCAKLQSEVDSRRKQITDINQWTEILLTYRHKIRDRVLWSMITDINNRTTD